MQRQSAAAGFTLLEAIVALAIFATGAMSLYGLFNAKMTAMARSQETAAQIPVVQQAVERLALTDLGQQSAGRLEVDGLVVSWSASLAQDVRQSQTTKGFLGEHEVGLYDVAIDVQRGSRTIGSWQLRLTGHQRVRSSLGI